MQKTKYLLLLATLPLALGTIACGNDPEEKPETTDTVSDAVSDAASEGPKVCNDDEWGPDCQKCSCNANQECNKDDGSCSCRTGEGPNCVVKLCENGTVNWETGHCLQCNDAKWTGPDCNQCADNYFGLDCEPCQCNEGQTCDKEDGSCYCANGGVGDNCVIKTCKNGLVNNENGQCISCQTSNWVGDNCDQCAENFFGDYCEECPVCGEHGTCNDGLTGNGQCACETGWTGATCNECDSNYYGEACTLCECGEGFHCEAGITGRGCVCEDKYEYSKVEINGLTWMAENLRNPCVEHKSANNDSNNDQLFGFLYKYKDANNACPEGWRLPTKPEFTNLISTAAASNKIYTNSSTNAFYALMIKTENLADNPWVLGFADYQQDLALAFVKKAKDTLGFSALPAGQIASLLGNEFGDEALFWSSTKSSESVTFEHYYHLHMTDDRIAIISDADPNSYFSVRCVKKSANGN